MQKQREQNANNCSSLGSEQPKLDRFLVCGLGSFGQYCVLALKEFDVRIIAVEQTQTQSWDIPSFPALLDELIIGDCRQINLLQKAGIDNCRAALIVTGNEQINAQTALTIRQLNPHTRLIVRSAKENLNQLLSEQLGNFVAYEPTELPVTAFALASMGNEILSFFPIEGQNLRVVQRKISAQDYWANNRYLYDLNTRNRRILAHSNYLKTSGQFFHQWDPNLTVIPGDTIVYIETADQLQLSPFRLSSKKQQTGLAFRASFFNFFVYIKNKIANFWQFKIQQRPLLKVSIFSGLILIFLLVTGTILLRISYPKTTVLSAFSATAILLLGGYSDLFGEFEQMDDIPVWLQLYSLALTLAGTAFVGVIYGVVTEALLSSKFQFLRNRPPIPQQEHIIIVGMGRIGQKVAEFLRSLKQSVVGIIFNPDLEQTILPQMPLIVGNIKESLAKANISTAKSVVVVTNDEILNLEVALMARKINPNSHIVIRTCGKQLSESLTQILPNAQVLATYVVASEAFAGAAFGENILSIFRFYHRTILVTEYQIEDEDTLHGLLLADVAYGYGVVPILHQKTTNLPTFMPSDDIRLSIGDRMVVLSTIEGLRRIEQGTMNCSPKNVWLRVEEAFGADSIFEGANTIARIAGCSLKEGRELMNNLPANLSKPLYKPQAMRLVRKLGKIRVKATFFVGRENQT